MPEPEIVDTIIVSQDIGIFEPSYKKIRLVLWEDSTVTWQDASE